jgi:hypothetical protein
MDFKTLLPDFNAIGKTDWAKPNFDTKNNNVIPMLGAVLMVVFVFFSWTTLTQGDEEATKLGITTWYGIFGFIMALGALVGVLYNHFSLTFTCAVLAIVFGIIGMVTLPDMEIEGVKMTSKEIQEQIDALKEAKKAGLPVKLAEVSHLGAILFTVASAVAALGAYLKITKK